ncbi:MAG TPA: sulfite exporter TauE/SafE family protein [Fulvivirga sp.]|nr:sulfite exporter TauE/SafE family protein [Fulvivirga sp.]
MIIISAILIGMVGSLHCVGMCGPIVMAVNYTKKGLFKNLLYHTGRIISYMSLGLIIGLAGLGISFAGFQQSLSIIAGLIIISITLLPKLKIIQNQWQSTILTPMKSKLLGAVKGNSNSTLFSLGLLNGLLPCGLVYVAIAASLATANPFQGALFMAGFGLGTWPIMLAIALGGSWVISRYRNQFQYVIPAISLLMGSLLIVRGLALDIPYLSPILALSGFDQITICK